jgi:large exoprotein involved in heme utilization and adhesion
MIGPQVRAGDRVDQLPRDANTVAAFSHRAFKDVTHAELAADLFNVGRLIGGAGNINIANGVAAPVTLTVALGATNAAGGTITLSNNGTINDTGSGIIATGSINITATGATADLNTGSGGAIQSNTASVNLTVGRDLNLGDSAGDDSIAAATGITATAGGNITLNANADVLNSPSGNIFLTAGGNFTMLTSPGRGAVLRRSSMSRPAAAFHSPPGPDTR